MAEHFTPSIDPVFLSASVPDPRRDPRYFQTGDSVAIRNAVIALVTVVLQRTRLVFGGHPAITPMVAWVAEQKQAFSRVRMFQSTFFRDRYLADIERFHYEEVEADPDTSSPDPSLLTMRRAMLACEPRFSAAFFIGGMEGVEAEYDMVKALPYPVRCYPVATTGGAARFLWERETRERMAPSLTALQTKNTYMALFTTILETEART